MAERSALSGQRTEVTRRVTSPASCGRLSVADVATRSAMRQPKNLERSSVRSTTKPSCHEIFLPSLNSRPAYEIGTS